MALNKLTLTFFLLFIILAHKTQSTHGRKLVFNKKGSVKLSNSNEAAFTPKTATPPPPSTPSPGRADDFRPTAPGHSPGIGHSL